MTDTFILMLGLLLSLYGFANVKAWDLLFENCRSLIPATDRKWEEQKQPPTPSPDAENQSE